jgi:hypothetical protein
MAMDTKSDKSTQHQQTARVLSGGNPYSPYLQLTDNMNANKHTTIVHACTATTLGLGALGMQQSIG